MPIPSLVTMTVARVGSSSSSASTPARSRAGILVAVVVPGVTATVDALQSDAPRPGEEVGARGRATVRPERLPGSDLPHSAAICTIEEADPVPVAAAIPAMRRDADAIWPESSPAKRPREGMVRALAAGLVAALAAGDPDAARIAHAAIGALLGPLSGAVLLAPVAGGEAHGGGSRRRE
jgi:hypothetical protein